MLSKQMISKKWLLKNSVNLSALVAGVYQALTRSGVLIATDPVNFHTGREHGSVSFLE